MTWLDELFERVEKLERLVAEFIRDLQQIEHPRSRIILKPRSPEPGPATEREPNV